MTADKTLHDKGIEAAHEAIEPLISDIRLPLGGILSPKPSLIKEIAQTAITTYTRVTGEQGELEWESYTFGDKLTDGYYCIAYEYGEGLLALHHDAFYCPYLSKEIEGFGDSVARSYARMGRFIISQEKINKALLSTLPPTNTSEECDGE